MSANSLLVAILVGVFLAPSVPQSVDFRPEARTSTLVTKLVKEEYCPDKSPDLAELILRLRLRFTNLSSQRLVVSGIRVPGAFYVSKTPAKMRNKIYEVQINPDTFGEVPFPNFDSLHQIVSPRGSFDIETDKVVLIVQRIRKEESAFAIKPGKHYLSIVSALRLGQVSNVPGGTKIADELSVRSEPMAITIASTPKLNGCGGAP